MKDKEILFEEKQYLGYNKYSISRRIVLALFCFFAYFIADNSKGGTYLFFLLGISILLLSVILLFVLHIRTKVNGESIILNGLWTAKKIKIDLKKIIKVEKTLYSKYILNNPVYNLHRKNVIRFYTGGGNEAVILTDINGFNYLIGSSKAQELVAIIQKCIEKSKF